MRTRSARLVPVLLPLVFAACGAPPAAELVCDPPCSAGNHCTESGCTPDHVGDQPDLAVAGDMTPTCSPACSGATPHCGPNRVCGQCLDDSHCPVGQTCRAVGMVNVCLPGCVSDDRCGGGAAKCCDGACVDTAGDPRNCGGCGMTCSAQHGRATCASSRCGPGTCDRGWDDCNHDPADGCEANLRVDIANCNGCGMTCSIPHAVAGCADGCYLAACKYGFDDCNGEAKDGCETSVQSDIANCGGCGMNCGARPRARVGCLNSACVLTSCDVGYADCDGNAVNGCEITVTNDARNCGRCGAACAQGQVCVNGGCTCPNCNLPNAKSVCVNLQCVVDVCSQGFGNCDGAQQNGCEQNLTSDVKNCGSCGVVCAQGLVCTNGSCTCPNCNLANAKSVCVNNQCLLDSCLPGYANCDQVPGNGCEVNLTTDKGNCNACGKACGANEQCAGGVCSAPQFTNGMGGLYDAIGINKTENAKLGCESHWGKGNCCNDGCGSCNNKGYHKCGAPNCNGSVYWNYDNLDQGMGCFWVDPNEILISNDGKNWIQ